MVERTQGIVLYKNPGAGERRVGVTKKEQLFAEKKAGF